MQWTAGKRLGCHSGTSGPPPLRRNVRQHERMKALFIVLTGVSLNKANAYQSGMFLPPERASAHDLEPVAPRGVGWRVVA